MGSLINRKEVDTVLTRTLDDLWNEFGSLWSDKSFARTGKHLYPRVNIQDLTSEVVIEAAVPGLTKDSVQVEYVDGLLTISASKQNDANSERNGYIVREMHKSSFSRSIQIDENVYDVNSIDASVKDGLLTVKIPKVVLDKPEKKRIIEVK